MQRKKIEILVKIIVFLRENEIKVPVVQSVQNPITIPKSASYVPPACTTRLPISVTRQDLEALREKSVAIKTCMTMTMEEIECLIRGNMVVKVGVRKCFVFVKISKLFLQFFRIFFYKYFIIFF